MQPSTPGYELNRVISNTFRFLVQSHLWTAGGQASLTLLSARVLGASPLAAALVFFFSLFVYNLDHLVDRRLESQWRQADRSVGAALSLLGLSCSLFCMLSAPLQVPLRIAAPLVIGSLYGIPALPWRGELLRLRDLPAMKAPLVAGTIVWCAVALPTAFAPGLWEDSAPLLALLLLIFALSNCVLSDLRDIEEDRRAGTRTLPVLFGAGPVRLGVAAVNLWILLSLLSPEWPLQPQPRLALALWALGNAICAAYLGRNNKDWEYAALVDGCPYLLLLSQL